ncbi:MAG TPA: class I SAM-dependent methyltransferase [Candidatus Thalassarchaeaceae archaeon]|jgi:hypothetical protein|nr:class I SAM-dependent methyltransferase [Candidatus Thalassarchaeaceae archaeon]|tara:strand:- start:20665 stop:21312 length:648 start_codon:yes stop_codon:yes gene_type:complete
MDEAHERMLNFFNKSENSERPLSWFEDVYSASKKDRAMVPWDWMEPHPFLTDWEKQTDLSGKALVVGSGLGEDAAFLCGKGWKVTAFDISESAVSWAKEIHPNCEIEWFVSDLQDPPGKWEGAFDLVLEVHILQAIPSEIRQRAATRLSSLVTKGGYLVCIGRLDDGMEATPGPPWPLSRPFIESIGIGLELVEFHASMIPGKESTRYRATWTNR